MRLVIGSDHAGWSYKEIVAAELRDTGYELEDVGTFGPDPVDYPDIARAVGERVARGDAERGILLCGSAVGVGVTANKIPGVRAGICHDTYSARQGVEHDDANVLCLGERVIGIALAREIVHSFLAARFTGEERHRRRLDKLLAIEREYMRDR